MGKITLLYAFFLAINSLAADTKMLLESYSEKADKLYAQGCEENIIESTVVLFSKLPELDFMQESEMQPVLGTADELNSLLKECVFFKPGPYEKDHLNDEQHKQVAKEMADFFLNIEGLSFYRILGSHIPGGVNIDTAPCAMGVVKEDHILIMQGGIIEC